MDDGRESTCDGPGVAELVSRIRDLESELEEARSRLLILRSRIAASRQVGGVEAYPVDAGSTVLPSPYGALPRSRQAEDSVEAVDAPDIVIEPLSAYDVLRQKWQLGEDPFSAAADSDPSDEASFADPGKRAKGRARLFGLLPDGHPWECSIAFEDLSKKGGITIGRDPRSSDIVLPESSVSRCHARLSLAPQGLVIEDKSSTNGVYVNEMLLGPYSSPMPLADGMTISLGEISLCVEILSF